MDRGNLLAQEPAQFHSLGVERETEGRGGARTTVHSKWASGLLTLTD